MYIQLYQTLNSQKQWYFSEPSGSFRHCRGRTVPVAQESKIVINDHDAVNPSVVNPQSQVPHHDIIFLRRYLLYLIVFFATP